MKIAILVGGIPPAASGGTEIATLEIARYAARAGHTVHIIARDQTARHPTTTEMSGFALHRVTARPDVTYYRDTIYALESLRIIQSVHPDLVHAQAMYMCPAAYLAGATKHIPWLFYERGGVYMVWKLNRLLYPLFLKSATRVVAQTEHQRDALMAYHQREIEIIPNGIDVSRFGVMGKDEARHQLRLTAGTIVLSVGRARPEKNTILFAEAAAADPGNLYMLVGDGPDLARVQQLRVDKGIGNLVLIGAVDNSIIPVYLAAADVLVNTSLSEGFPVSLLEGMAAGLPIVAPRTCGIPELVVDGVNGLLTRPNDRDSLVGAIRTIVDSPVWAGIMSSNNRHKAADYSWEKVVGALYGSK